MDVKLAIGSYHTIHDFLTRIIMRPCKNINIDGNHVKNLTWIMPSETRDRVEKSRIAARRLKNLAGDTRNINESKINLDS